jgi:hypothetical protein
MNLAFCPIMDSTLYQISNNPVFAYLEDINLSYCNIVTDEGYIDFFINNKFRSLKKLALQGV